MLFHSVAFLFLFLPCLFLCLRVIPLGIGRGITVLVFSYLFYSGNEPRFLWLLLISSLLDYGVALRLSRASGEKGRLFWLSLSILGNFGLLGFFKYGAFLLETFTPFISYVGFPSPSTSFYKTFVLPAGISFYTFQSLSYTVDVYRRHITPTWDLVGFFNYVAYLPQLIAGPIERYSALAPQIQAFIKGESRPQISAGLDRIALGIIQKLLIADSASRIVDTLAATSHAYSFTTAWAIALGFGIQIYYDFAAYTHMAIGIALLMGVRLTENFLSPYKAYSVQEFWHRWHVTLSRRRFGRVLVNIMITFVLSGLWHGADWNFVAWGFAHGALLTLYLVYKRLLPETSLPRPLAVFLTFVAVHFAWILFRFHELPVIVEIWRAMCGLSGVASTALALPDILFLLLVTAATLTLPNASQRWPGKKGAWESLLLWSIALFSLFSAPQIQQFIYFQF